jgi:hypothetical protein
MQDPIDPKLQNWREAYHLFKVSQSRAKAAGKKITHEVRAEVSALRRKAEIALRQLHEPSTAVPKQPDQA